MYKVKIESSTHSILFVACFVFFACLQQSVFAQTIATKNKHTADTLRNDASVSQLYHLTDSQYTPVFFPAINSSLNSKSENVNWPGVIVTSAALAGIYTGLFSYEQNRRWNGPRVPFYFTHSLSTNGADKAGHFFATQAQASVISNLYTLSDVSPRASALIGAGMALSVQTLVELKDGRIDDRGFGIYDEIANLLGAGWFYTRQQSELLQRFQVRWLYYPSSTRDLLPQEHRFTEDYNGHSYWVSMRVWDILPFYWPKFIVPAVGITLNDWIPNSDQQGFYSFHISLNPDFNYIIPRRTALGRTLADFFNNFYIPAPAVQIYPNPGFKLIFYGQK